MKEKRYLEFTYTAPDRSSSGGYLIVIPNSRLDALKKFIGNGFFAITGCTAQIIGVVASSGDGEEIQICFEVGAIVLNDFNRTDTSAGVTKNMFLPLEMSADATIVIATIDPFANMLNNEAVIELAFTPLVGDNLFCRVYMELTQI